MKQYVTRMRGTANQKKVCLSMIIVCRGGHNDRKKRWRQERPDSENIMLISLGFILREKEIAVLKNFTKREYDLKKYGFTLWFTL